MRSTRHQRLLPRRRRPRTTDENGRGLLLVDQLSRKWSTRNTPDGKLIWAEQRLTPSPCDQPQRPWHMAPGVAPLATRMKVVVLGIGLDAHFGLSG
ncbi:ATP-binding protein [Streptomyces wuyuanensis]|uniref:ATP-binding protein n=1 Tax=Streptomyces wuyuanensis TaxID=1196353 RepID=UPI000B8486A0